MICLVNHSPRITPAEVSLMAAACFRQILYHVAPAWGRTPRSLIVCPNDASVPADAWLIAILNDADQAGVLGYHSLTPRGLPYGRCFVSPILDNGGTVLTGDNSVSATLSHEVAETFIDPGCNLWCDGPNNQAWSYEVADTCESFAYPMAVGNQNVSVSDFVFPEFFMTNPPAGSRFDQMKMNTEPFQVLDGGYAVIESQGQRQQISARSKAKQTFAAREAHAKSKDHPASRTWKRLHRHKS